MSLDFKQALMMNKEYHGFFLLSLYILIQHADLKARKKNCLSLQEKIGYQTQNFKRNFSFAAYRSNVRYLGKRFEFFRRRFAPVDVPTQMNSVPDRSRRALLGTLVVAAPLLPSGAYSQKPPKILKITVFSAAIRPKACYNSTNHEF